MRLLLDQNQIHIFKNDTDVLTLPASAATEITYGQDVHRRIGAGIGLAAVSFGAGALMAFAKSKKHYIGVTWDDAGKSHLGRCWQESPGTMLARVTWDDAGKKGGAAFQADKNDYRGVLAGLKGLTGKRAMNSDTMTVKN